MRPLKRLSLVDRPQKAFDPCLDTGEVGEGPVESPVEAVREAAGRVEDFPGPVVPRDAAVLEKLEKKRSVGKH